MLSKKERGIFMVDKYGQKWTEEETILAFYLYCQVPFSKITKTNPEIIRLAKILGRTPSSVGLKMANLAHFDPELRKTNRTGMKELYNLVKLCLFLIKNFGNY